MALVGFTWVTLTPRPGIRTAELVEHKICDWKDADSIQGHKDFSFTSDIENALDLSVRHYIHTCTLTNCAQQLQVLC